MVESSRGDVLQHTVEETSRWRRENVRIVSESRRMDGGGGGLRGREGICLEIK